MLQEAVGAIDSLLGPSRNELNLEMIKCGLFFNVTTRRV
jgi:hypothetical protein